MATVDPFIKPGSRIFVAGHRGPVGSDLVRRLESQGYTNLVLRARQELNLLDARAVASFFAEKPEFCLFGGGGGGGGGYLRQQHLSGGLCPWRRETLASSDCSFAVQTASISATVVHQVPIRSGKKTRSSRCPRCKPGLPDAQGPRGAAAQCLQAAAHNDGRSAGSGLSDGVLGTIVKTF
jgi:hypothetical protein